MPFVTSNDIRTRYEVEGHGHPLVLHVGFLGSLEDWSRDDTAYVQALRGDYQLILVDPRGQGQSDKPHDNRLYLPEARAGDIVAVLDELGIERAHFWGYSMGGRVGLMLASRHQDRLLSLIIGGTSPFTADSDPKASFLYQWMEHGMVSFVDEWERNIGPLPKGARERWLAGDAEALRASMLAPNQSQEIASSLGMIAVPTLLYAGSEDHPELVEKTAGLIPGGRYFSLEGLDHAMAFRRSDLILPEVTRFLATVKNDPGQGASTA